MKAAKDGLTAFADPLREQFLDERLKGLDAPTRVSVIEAVKAAKRTPAQQALVKAHPNAEISDDELAKRFPEYAALRDGVRKAVTDREKDRPKPAEKIAAFVETDPTPAVHHVLKRGQHNQPGDEVQPGAPAAFSTAKNAYAIAPRPEGRVSTGRRLRVRELGDVAGQPAVRPGDGEPRLAAPLRHRPRRHARQPRRVRRESVAPGVARLLGRGVREVGLEREVAAPADSHVGRVPPEQRVGAQNLDAIDPGDRLLGRFPGRRLDAEAVRVAMLHVSGELGARARRVWRCRASGRPKVWSRSKRSAPGAPPLGLPPAAPERRSSRSFSCSIRPPS